MFFSLCFANIFLLKRSKTYFLFIILYYCFKYGFIDIFLRNKNGGIKFFKYIELLLEFSQKNKLCFK